MQDEVTEARTYYRDKKGKEITKAQFEKLQGIAPKEEEVKEDADQKSTGSN